MTLQDFLVSVDDFMYTYILILLLAAVGLFLTFRSRFVQIRMFTESFKVIFEKKHDDASISSFQALMVATASRVGTGNIAGVATAIVAGGPGALFWRRTATVSRADRPTTSRRPSTPDGWASSLRSC